MPVPMFIGGLEAAAHRKLHPIPVRTYLGKEWEGITVSMKGARASNVTEA